MKEEKDEFEDILSNLKPENRIFVDFALDIAEQVRYSLSKNKDINTQKKLAEKLGKSEAEISKWLSGVHNLTLESMSKIMAVLGDDIILTDIKARKKYFNKKRDYEVMNMALEMALLSISGDSNGVTDVSFNFETTSGNNNTIPILPQKATA